VKAVHVGTDPVPNFSATPLSVCAADSVAFTDLSLEDDSTVWMFGDGGGSTLKNPNYKFTDTGYFEVTLLAINSGCKNRLTKSMFIRVLPTISNFTFKSNCTKQSQVFFENSSVVDSSLGDVSYEWSFGDPNRTTDIQKNTNFNYAAPGNYIVRLVSRNGNCTDTSYKTIGVNLDVADFEFPSAKACRNDFVTAVATKSSPNNIDSYLWTIDGGPLTPGSSSLTTSFSTLGDHTVGLVINNRNGCSDTMVKKSVINISGPIARLATQMGYGVCVNGSLTFKDSSSFLAPPSKWVIDFGDGQTQEFSSTPFVHQYLKQGNFSARMKVTDTEGCSDYSTSAVKMITKPIADFSAGLTTICPGVNNIFQNLSQGINLKSSWDFGDGNTQQGSNPVHTYSGNDAYYSVSLTVTDTNGCSASISKDNYIRVLKPKPAFNAENTASVCSPMETKFKFAGTDYVSHFWDFGDGNQSTLKNPNHFYNDFGDYTTKLYLKGYGGCLDSVTYVVSVFDVVKSTKIEMDPILSCNELLVNFKLTSPSSLKLSFTPGDGGYDTTGQKLFQHFYKSIGYYYPSITLRDSSGCQASRGSDQTVRVMGAIPIFGQDKRNFCDSGTVAFSNSSIKNEPITSTVWDMGDGGILTDQEPSYKFTRPGTFVTRLTLTTRSGCVSTATDTVRVYATPYTRIKGDSTLCLNNALYLSSNLIRPDTAVRWSWNFGNGISSVSQNPAITYTTPGTYKISLQTTNKLGCSATNTHEVLVSPFPIITVKENPILPVGLSIPLPISYSKDVTTYKWSPSVGLSCTDCAIPVAKPIYNTTYQIEVSNQYGCVSNSSIKVTVQCNEKNYFMPNTFSPNNDGNNDIFYPRSVGVSRVQTMKLFNRWGQLVFEKKDFYSNDISSGWNGTIQGQPAPMDTYVYYIELICENSKILPLKGNVTLIR
jgi:gliding motility-associated-like protein